MGAMPYKDPEKQKAAQAKHYRNNKEKYQTARIKSRRLAYAKIAEIKESGPCKDCNIFYPYYVMQFDHVGTNKVAEVSRLVRTRGWAVVQAEINKCELVCANCHAIRTYSRLSQ